MLTSDHNNQHQNKHHQHKQYQLAADLGAALYAAGASVCTVESCTGGGLAYAITEVPGSSSWINQSFITYSNDAKVSLVGVQQSTLDEFGAVSEQVVTEMALGGRQRAGADYALSISGIAGPSGGTEDKPVGLVHFALASANGVETFNRCFSGDRALIRKQAILLALEKLIFSVVNT